MLNVAGPRASKDPKIYKDTLNILESSYYLGLVHSGTPTTETVNLSSQRPQNIDEAVERLISQMPLKDKTTMANMSPDELPNLKLSLGEYIMNNFGLLSGNHKLLESCRLEADDTFEHEENAVAIIITALWKKLRQTHKLRVIK